MSSANPENRIDAARLVRQGVAVLMATHPDLTPEQAAEIYLRAAGLMLAAVSSYKGAAEGAFRIADELVAEHAA